MEKKYDKSSKWLIETHGDSILRLAGVTGFVSWTAVQPELVQPQKLPDGLLDVRFAGEDVAVPYLIEIDARPDRRSGVKMPKNAMLVYLARGQWPEAITLVLTPRGEVEAGHSHRVFSRSGRSRNECSWDAVNLWTLPAHDLLAMNDVGLVPWIPLTKYDEPPEVIVEECRRRIETAPAGEQLNLAVVTTILGGLRYNDPNLWNILGGLQTMIESPILMDFLAEQTQRTILDVLEGRFGSLPPALTLRLRAVKEHERLRDLARFAGVCTTPAEFEARLTSEG